MVRDLPTTHPPRLMLVLTQSERSPVTRQKPFEIVSLAIAALWDISNRSLRRHALITLDSLATRGGSAGFLPYFELVGVVQHTVTHSGSGEVRCHLFELPHENPGRCWYCCFHASRDAQKHGGFGA